jgi:hypothetical protein
MSVSMPAAAPRSGPPYDPPRTTLGGSASVAQPPATVARRRIGRWIIIGALAGGTGAAIAVVTARGGPGRTSAAVPALTEVAVPGPPDATVAPIAVVPAIPSDAGTADTAVVVPDHAPAEPPGRIPPNGILRKPAPTKKAAKPLPTKSPVEDLYDDRN